MKGFTAKYIVPGYEDNSSENYTYDEKGRIIKVKDSYGNEMNYSYSRNQIIEESPLKGSYPYKSIYQLDAGGKIVSAVMKYNKVGTDEVHSLKYLYDSFGYLSEVQDTYEGDIVYTKLDKYNYTNGNLTSIVRTDPKSNVEGTLTTFIEYTNDLAASRFFTTYVPDIPNAEILKAYFGKASKNLISKIWGDVIFTLVSYTYQVNEEGNVTQMTLNGNGGSMIYRFNYITCK